MRFKVLIAGVLLVTLASCDSFLNVPPENAVVPSNFFQSESDFRQAVNGIYAPLQERYDSEGNWAMAEMRSDNTHYFYNPDYRGYAFQIESIADFLVDEDNTYTDDKYFADYDVIARANQVLAAIDDAEIDQSAKDNLKGQALFLRAFAYLDLVRFYGAVPLPLEPATSLESASLPRSPASAVYDQIITDATEAASLLPNRPNQTPGRATSGAAWTLLGDVYITLEQWGKAEEALKNVTEYSLLADYADIFDPANKNNSESIFEIQYMGGASQGLYSTFPYDFVPITGSPSKLTMGPPGPTQSVAGWNIPSQDLIAAYEDTTGDERFDASINFYTGPSPISDTNYVNLPYIKKYQHPHSIYEQTNQNFPVYRYAGVLLMLAEATNEQGKTGEARDYLNQVRSRAGLGGTSATGQTALREAILHERRIELAFENKRWLDLVRTGKAVPVMNDYGAELKSDPDYYYLSPNTYNVDQNDLLFPIPYSEIQANPELTQNPGY